MNTIRVERDNELAIVTLSRKKSNPLNYAMVNELLDAVNEISRDDGVRGVVLASDRPGFFSVGFDVHEVFHYDRTQMAALWDRFVDLYEELARMPKPVVAALSGHTFAGGAILAMACDARVMADDEDLGFAVSGINLGIPLPVGVMRLAVNAVGIGHARQLFLTGETISPSRAHVIGLARYLSAADQVVNLAVGEARILAKKAPHAYAAIKAMFDTVTGMDAAYSDKQNMEQFLDYWFAPEAEARRQAVAKALAKHG